jgi:hypothetical protein
MKRTSAKGQARQAKQNTRKRNNDALSLSPEQLEDRATTTTKLLNAILSRPEANYYSRHWGINE